MERIVKLFLVVVAVVMSLSMTAQYLAFRMESMRIALIAKELEYDDLMSEYIKATSNDGYIVPEAEYLVFPFYPDAAVYVTSQFHLRGNPFEENSGPILIEEKLHKGIDLKSFKQNIIRSTVSGTVVAHWPPPNGYWKGDGAHGGRIIIRDSNGVFHAFSHLSETYVSSIEGRNLVEAGQEIGRMGNTGLTTGSHLHYEIYISPDPDGKVIDGQTLWYDPIYYFNIRIGEHGEVLFPEEAIAPLQVRG